ncbi:DNA internalization-related competence protein ComEC/Rec2 [Shewanella avicenniae]|uniref:DNA internalization-related competence protein ComEC/Rec2 n=1 Tax=Shewanella avicenniae TaxID=2814294 RepID=A0ABX7QLR9_9GAMM|nr:DNA internalization-related competence protein ComEC/Rec2 [Shewanella avicenniae]
MRAEIISLVSVNGDWISFDVQQLANGDSDAPLRRWRLGWDLTKQASQLLPQVGEIWQFELKPKAFSSVLNQGGFNQQRQLLSQHIEARANVISAQKVAEIAGLRAGLLASVKAQLQGVAHRDILLALTMGERSEISAARWQQLRNSGTAHLVAISGLHLSVVSLYLLLMMKWALNRFWPVESRRNFILANLSAIAIAAAYAWLAGWGIPVQRALLMLVVVVVSQLTMRASSSWERLLWALALVLLFDPLAPLSNGFWLSFFALALILSEWRSPAANEINNGIWPQVKQWGLSLWRIQWRLCLGMSLLQLLLFGGLTLHSFWINLLLVPWFSLLVIPLVMLCFCLGMLGSALGFTELSTALWQLTSNSLVPAEWLWQLADHLVAAWWPLSAELAMALMLALIAVTGGWRLLRPQQCYWLVIPCVPLGLQLLLMAEWVRPAGWQLHVLDVGQGLAVVVQQGQHGLLYDTGASFDDFSYAERVIVPFLQHRGIAKLDYLVVSHGDNDHAGGATYIMQQYPEAQVITDLSQLKASDNCRPHRQQWRDLNLGFLGPLTPSTGNNGSCVLRIYDAAFSVLLPGDIELPAEIGLTKREAELNSDLLLAPHHGSNTSSTDDLLSAVAPRWAIFAAGYQNRWGFPKAEVQQRYQAHGVETFVTGEQGQLSIEIANGAQSVRSYRADIAPYWYNRLIAFGNPVNPE